MGTVQSGEIQRPEQSLRAACANGFAAEIEDEYDYIVVGSGGGGAPVAANLAKAGFQVLLLEAGGCEEPVEYKVPAFHALSVEHNDLAWKFYVRHYADDARQCRDRENFLNEQIVDSEPRKGIFYPRAGTLGGCTAHHAMALLYPHNRDWEHIAQITGDRSWSPRRMRRYFERLERCEYVKFSWSRRFNRGRHGFGGWLPTTLPNPKLLLRDMVLARLMIAAAETWFEAYVRRCRSPLSLLYRIAIWFNGLFDPNDWRRVRKGFEGPALTPLTIRNGVRFGTRELIREIMAARPDRLTVKLHALVSRVVLDADDRATGVEFLDGRHLYRADPAAPLDNTGDAPLRTVRARREVILAAGTFNTPQLLMLSGIGPPDELARHKIDVRVVLRGVGRNMQDRYEVGVVHKMRADFKLLENATFAEDDPDFADWRNGHGLYASNGMVAAILKRSSHCQPDPDLCLFAIPGYFTGYRPRYSERSRDKNYFTWVILKGHTKNNAGRVLLRSADPRDPPDINFRYFEEGNDTLGDDLDALVAGVEFVRKITRRTASLFVEEIPGPQCRSRAEIAQFIRDSAWGHHASGTCRIGAADDKYAVLDSRFRVKGTSGLRVVDASVFPKIPGLFILSAVYMIAEKASDVILEDAYTGTRVGT
jgi:choline dehydrogenase-like flavoprotein